MSLARENDVKCEETVEYQRKHVQGEAEEEEKEVLVITIAETVIDECAMVVESLDALIAVVTMSRIFWS